MAPELAKQRVNMHFNFSLAIETGKDKKIQDPILSLIELLLNDEFLQRLNYFMGGVRSTSQDF